MLRRGATGLAVLSLALFPMFVPGLSPPPAHATVFASAGVKAPQRPAYFNPVFGHPFPDPMVLRVGRSYDAYATHSGPVGGGRVRITGPTLESTMRP